MPSSVYFQGRKARITARLQTIETEMEKLKQERRNLKAEIRAIHRRENRT
jgi:predicted  nucleic acid-binding Zn-ribbon protein